MTDPEVSVTLTDTEFTRGEIQAFLDEIGGQDGMSANALIEVTHTIGAGPTLYTLKASTAFRSKDS